MDREKKINVFLFRLPCSISVFVVGADLKSLHGLGGSAAEEPSAAAAAKDSAAAAAAAAGGSKSYSRLPLFGLAFAACAAAAAGRNLGICGA